MNKRAGSSLLQLIVGSAITVTILAGLFYMMAGFQRVQIFNTALPGVQFDAETMAQTLAADLRKATLCTGSDSGCTVDAVLSGAGTSGVTVYARSGGTLEQHVYAISGGNFQRTIGGTATVLQTDATLNLTYYSSNTYRTSSWTAMGSPPDDTQAKSVIAVGITATVTRSGVETSYSTIVRLRNSPKKATSFD